MLVLFSRGGMMVGERGGGEGEGERGREREREEEE